ncbi:MAG: serine--tRNA ligase, partial [Metallosphaera sp.]
MSWSLLELIRNNPDSLMESLRKRNVNPQLAEKAVELDKKWRAILQEVEKLRHEHNVVSSQIPRLSPEERKKKIEEARNLLSIIEAKEKELKTIEEERDNILRTLPNVVHESVPVGPDDSYNVPIKVWGKFRVYEKDVNEFLSQVKGLNPDYEIIKFKPVGHADELEAVLKLGNTAKAGEVAGSRFYYLFEDVAWLEQALIAYALDVITSKGYSLVIPPYMLRGEVIQSVIDLDTFKDA